MEPGRKLVFNLNFRNWTVGFWWDKFRSKLSEKPFREFYFDVGPFQIGYVYDVPDNEMVLWDDEELVEVL